MKKKNKKENTGYKLIIFDFDGTLVDSVPSIHKTANQLAKLYGKKPVPMKKVVGAVGAGLNLFLEWIFPDVTKERGTDAVKADYVKRYRINHNYKLKAFPGVAATLAYLKARGVKMAIISNKLGKFVKSSANSAGIGKYFRVVYGRGDLKKDKPDPMPVLHTIKRFGVKKRETLFVGDSRYDAKCAKAAGVRFFYVTYGYDSHKNVMEHGAHYKTKNFRDLKDLV